jgi:hypothetical protein
MAKAAQQEQQQAAAQVAQDVAAARENQAAHYAAQQAAAQRQQQVFLMRWLISSRQLNKQPLRRLSSCRHSKGLSNPPATLISPSKVLFWLNHSTAQLVLLNVETVLLIRLIVGFVLDYLFQII